MLITIDTNGGTPGTMEFFVPVKTDDGLKIHITSASPFAIGWKQLAGNARTSSAQSASTGYVTNVMVPILIVLIILSAAAVAAFTIFDRRRVSKSGK